MFGTKIKHALSQEEQEAIRWNYDVLLSVFLNDSQITQLLYRHLSENCGLEYGISAGDLRKRISNYEGLKAFLDHMIDCPNFTSSEYTELNKQLSEITKKHYDKVLKFRAEMDLVPLMHDLKEIQGKIEDLKKKAA